MFGHCKQIFWCNYFFKQMSPILSKKKKSKPDTLVLVNPVHWSQLKKKFSSAFSCRNFGFVDDCVQVGVEEEKVIIFSMIFLGETVLVEVLEEIINGLDGGQVRVRFALLMAPETGFPHLQLDLE